MKKLIWLSGQASCGKTTTLKMLIAMLLDLKNPHTVSVIYTTNHMRLNTLLTAWQNNSKMPDGEFSVVLQIDDVIVGIRTMGDTIGSVWDSVAFFEKHDCNIGVLACHEDHLQRSGTCLIDKWKSEKITKGRASDSSLHDQENRAMAKKLFNEVMNAIKQVKASHQSSNQSSSSQCKN